MTLVRRRARNPGRTRGARPAVTHLVRPAHRAVGQVRPQVHARRLARIAARLARVTRVRGGATHARRTRGAASAIAVQVRPAARPVRHVRPRVLTHRLPRRTRRLPRVADVRRRARLPRKARHTAPAVTHLVRPTARPVRQARPGIHANRLSRGTRRRPRVAGVRRRAGLVLGTGPTGSFVADLVRSAARPVRHVRPRVLAHRLPRVTGRQPRVTDVRRRTRLPCGAHHATPFVAHLVRAAFGPIGERRIQIDAGPVPLAAVALAFVARVRVRDTRDAFGTGFATALETDLVGVACRAVRDAASLIDTGPRPRAAVRDSLVADVGGRARLARLAGLALSLVTHVAGAAVGAIGHERPGVLTDLLSPFASHFPYVAYVLQLAGAAGLAGGRVAPRRARAAAGPPGAPGGAAPPRASGPSGVRRAPTASHASHAAGAGTPPYPGASPGPASTAVSLLFLPGLDPEHEVAARTAPQ